MWEDQRPGSCLYCGLWLKSREISALEASKETSVLGF